MEKHFSQACENNKTFILSVLQSAFDGVSSVLEIGSGTGQHAVYMAPRLPNLQWHTSDRLENHGHITAWIREFPYRKLHDPMAFTIGQDPWPLANADGVFSANTAHIMQPQETQLMMAMVAENLPKGGVFCQYGPFNLNGEYTSESNQLFDQDLRDSGYGGIVDVDALQSWAGDSLRLVERIAMPANNMMLVWRKA